MQEKNILTVIPMNAKHQELLKKTAQDRKSTRLNSSHQR